MKIKIMSVMPVLFALVLSGGLHAETAGPHCTINDLEGGGTATVRRSTGIEMTAAKEMPIYAGDKISTDANTVVSLFFPDGSVMRVGINSEYLLKEVKEENKAVSWAFDLFKGGVRAIIENFSVKKPSKYRLSTPEGTIGIRGTELILQHDPESAASQFYLMEGEVDLGPVGCFEKNNCTRLKAGNRVEFKSKQMSAPQPFTRRDLTGVSVSQAQPQNREARTQRATLLSELKKNGGVKAILESKDDGEINAQLANMDQKLQELQAQQLGVDTDTLRKLQKAKKEGRLGEYLSAAERYTKMSGEEGPDSEVKMIALGSVVAEKKGYNDGKFDRVFVKQTRRQVDVAGKLAKTDGAAEGGMSNWRSVMGVTGDSNNDPSPAIKSQQAGSNSVTSNALKGKRGANTNPGFEMVNKGGILTNVSKPQEPSSAAGSGNRNTASTPSPMEAAARLLGGGGRSSNGGPSVQQNGNQRNNGDNDRDRDRDRNRERERERNRERERERSNDRDRNRD